MSEHPSQDWDKKPETASPSESRQPQQNQEQWNNPNSYQPKPAYLQDANSKKILAGILAIILGHIGIHKFVLGYNNEGIILLVLGVAGYVTACFLIGYFILLVTSVIGLVEGIIYLTKSDEDFYNTYIKHKKPWF